MIQKVFGINARDFGIRNNYAILKFQTKFRVFMSGAL